MLDLDNALLIIALLSNFGLGFTVWRSNPKEKLNVSFGIFSLITVLWIGSNLLFFNSITSVQYLRFVYALGALVLPSSIIWVSLMVRGTIQNIHAAALIFLSIFLFVVTFMTDTVVNFVSGGIGMMRYTLIPGIFFPVYSLIQFTVYIVLLYILIKGLWEVEKVYKIRRGLVFVGALLYGLVSVYTSFIAPVIYDAPGVFPYDAQSSIILVALSTYAILRYKLFNIKVITTELFALLITLISATRFITVTNKFSFILEGAILVATILFAILLVRSVKKEIENREKGERLARYLANANARLRELDKQKTEFVSIASHQLRSPIAAIKGYTSMMMEGAYGKVSSGLEEPLKRILESGQRISIMVDDFLNVTRIEQGRMTYDMKSHNVCDLISIVAEELQIVANEKGLKLTVNCDSNAGLIVRADEGKLKQIFSNLIDNAIKYTPKGSIIVSAEKLEQERKILVKIRDTGIGIAPEEVQNLFQKFNRASNANEANVLGTGLGLYIAREIMKAHEGWIDVQSEGLGKGSTFTVELPTCDEVVEEKN